ncbi:hypothetical protein ABPG74_003329 [Tetrahymena malaccensis]
MSIVSIAKKYVFGSYIPVIVINTGIDAKTTQDVRNSIAKIDADRAKAVALLINSPGGSPVQCDIITEMVKGFSKKHHLPLYTFADDIAASGGQFLLSIGDKSFAQETSLVGSVGVVGMWFGLGNLAKEYKLKPEIFSSNQEQQAVYMNFFQDLTPEKKEKINRTLKIHHQIFIEHIEKYSHFKITPQEREKKIYDASIILGKDAVQYGLVDEIGQYQSILNRDFPGVQIEIISSESWRQKILGSILARFGVSTQESKLDKNLLLM